MAGKYANPDGGTLNLGVLPSFGTRWLVPRLPAFIARHPGISVNLLTRSSLFDFKTDTVDAAIHFGLPHWPGTELVFLMHEKIVAVCSPAFKTQHRFSKPDDLLHVPLLHMTTRPDAWEQWFRSHGVVFDNVHGMLFDQFTTITEAASAGLGVSLIPAFMIEEELRSGRLVAAVAGEAESEEAYYLACMPDRAGYAPLESFRRWIVSEAGGGTGVEAGEFST